MIRQTKGLICLTAQTFFRIVKFKEVFTTREKCSQTHCFMPRITSLVEARAVHKFPQWTAELQKFLTLTIITAVKATCSSATFTGFLHILHLAEVCNCTASTDCRTEQPRSSPPPAPWWSPANQHSAQAALQHPCGLRAPNQNKSYKLTTELN